MQLTKEQQAMLDGEQGEAFAKVMKTLVMYGETFGAEKMVPVTSKEGHLVTSFGLSVMKPVYQMMEELIEAGAVSKQQFTIDPRPVDHKNVPSSLIQKIVFSVMYNKQKAYEEQLKKLGLKNKDAFSCTCYMEEIGNIPQKGDILSWAESSAVVYANSVLGARCNRNSGIIDLFGCIAGCVPYFGLLTDEGRKATWVIDIQTKELPEAQILGSAIGMKVMEEVPYIRGLAPFLNETLDDTAKAYLKDMGAATASNGAVGLYHVEGLTPEAVELKESLLSENYKVYVIDEAELERVKNSYPCIWENPDAKPKLCFIGCPHLSMEQLIDWTNKIEEAIQKEGKKKVQIPTVLTAAPGVAEKFRQTKDFERLKKTGAKLSSICPLMYMNNPKCRTMPVITNSNKLRTYTSSRYHTDREILTYLAKGGR